MPAKFGSERIVYVPAELITVLAEHVRSAGVRPGEWLFSTVVLPTLCGLDQIIDRLTSADAADQR